jgi:hypothetical protein
MTLEIRDPEVIGAVRPRDLASYLRATGWSFVDQEEGRYTIWAANGGAEEVPADTEILVPVSRDSRDYALRVGEALRALSEIEKKTVEAILVDVQHASADVVRIRLEGIRAAGGEVPVDQGASLIGGAKDLMFAAACAATQRRPYFHTRRPPAAVNYMRDRVRLGQTERGSFVVTLISDLPMASAQVPLDPTVFEEVDPFERRVTRTLQTALASAAVAAEDALVTGGFESFQAAVEDGVSSNLCAAIAATAEEEQDASVAVDFSWAITRPLPERDRRERPETRFTRDALEVVGEAAKVLKSAGPLEDYQVFGPVERLDRPEGEAVGTISIATLVLDRPARVRVTLDDRQYGKAIRAHEKQLPVTISGTLVRSGRQWELQDPATLTVLEPGSDD